MTDGIEAAKWFGFTNPDRNYLGHALSKIERIEQQQQKMPIKTQIYVVLTG